MKSTRWLVLLFTAWAFADARAAETNLLLNADFERVDAANDARPESWTFFASEGESNAKLVEVPTHKGDWALALSAMGKVGAFNGVYQAIGVAPGRAYSVAAYFQVVDLKAFGKSAYAQMDVEWKDENGTEIDRVWGEALTSKRLEKGRWTKAGIDQAVAPANAARAVIGVHLYDGTNGCHGAVIVDDLAVTSN